MQAARRFREAALLDHIDHPKLRVAMRCTRSVLRLLFPARRHTPLY